MSHSLNRVVGSSLDEVPIRRALISVSNKNGIVELASVLHRFGVEILSTGGTAEALRNASIPVVDVSKYTGFSEILDGRVKTLHPKIHGALLAVRGNEKHDQECAQNGIGAIDLLIMNLYPFHETVASGADFDTCIENIDIGGPAMLRSSAKNHRYITVLTDPSQYTAFQEALQRSSHMESGHGTVTTSLEARRHYAAAAFHLSASYEAAIAVYFAQQVEGEHATSATSATSSSTASAPEMKESEKMVSAEQIGGTKATTECTQAGQEMDVCSQGTAAESESEQQQQQEVSLELEKTGGDAEGLITRTYKPELTLKYGCNPHQNPAAIYSITQPSTPSAPSGSTGSSSGKPVLDTTTNNNKMPFQVLSGVPGYINLLDACYSWQLVRELSEALDGAPAAASYKHCSPAGAAVGTVPLTAEEAAAYEVVNPSALTPVALAYLRARNADPMCSFGDFAAISHTVDKCTAQLIKTVICDGIIAPGFDKEALTILKAKKKGAFIVLQADAAFKPPTMEYRELFGCVFSQRRNDAVFGAHCLDNVVVAGTGLQEGTTTTGSSSPQHQQQILPAPAQRDLILASICIKYTQSNSVGYACNGQMIGVGAGQQSRVDCVKLAGRKVAVWYLRQHPKVQQLPFKSSVKRQDRVNARVRYIEGDITPFEMPFWQEGFECAPEPLTEAEKTQFLATLSGVALSSDAFFPFRDSIDHASRYGVQYVAQPGGSVADEEVKEACKEYGMAMVFTNLRLFLH